MKQYTICQKCGHVSIAQELIKCSICAASRKEMLFDHFESDFNEHFLGKNHENFSSFQTTGTSDTDTKN